MHTHRAIDIRMTFAQRFHRRRIVGTDTNAEKMPDATLPRSLQRRIKRALVRGEIESIKMTVGVDEHSSSQPGGKPGSIAESRRLEAGGWRLEAGGWRLEAGERAV